MGYNNTDMDKTNTKLTKQVNCTNHPNCTNVTHADQPVHEFVKSAKMLLPQTEMLPRFFMTSETPCPYLPDRFERKLFTSLSPRINSDSHPHVRDDVRIDAYIDDGRATELNTALTQAGFRRNQDILWRPVCNGCQACHSARVLVDAFTPSRTQARTIRRNRKITTARVPAHATHEQFALFKTYLVVRHPGVPHLRSNMNDMGWNDYQDMIESGHIDSYMIEYRDAEKLVACVLIDNLYDGVSLLYSFFDPSARSRSLGTYVIIDQIRATHAAQKPYLYLGYWIAQSPKMMYKEHFQPLEVLGEKGWILLQDHKMEKSLNASQAAK